MIGQFIAAAMLLTQSTQQFDLTCTGTRQGSSLGNDNPVEAWSERYRIDLDRMVWCNGDCSSSQSIARANSGEIVLTDQTIGEGGEERHTINRSDGRLVYRVQLGSGEMSYRSSTLGKCQKANFTNIPTAAF